MLYILNLVVQQIGTNFQEAIKQFLSGSISLVQLMERIKCAALNGARKSIRIALELKDKELKMNRSNSLSIVNINRERTIITSIGSITYSRTLYKDRSTGKCAYLLDDYIGMPSHRQLTDDAVARVLQEVAYSSYYKAGKQASLDVSLGGTPVSKQTVHNIIHSLHFPPYKPPEKKRTVTYLFIEADEDHAHLQLIHTKGDVKRDPKTKRKNNGKMVKLVYVHEGYEEDPTHNHKCRIKNAHYFAGLYEGDEQNDVLWAEVWAYIEATYDIDSIESFNLGSDGGTWIQAGCEIIGMTFYLDGFHFVQKIATIINILTDEEAKKQIKKELRQAVIDNKIEEFTQKAEAVAKQASTDSRKNSALDAKDFIVNNWDAARRRLNHPKEIVGCSTEAHVYHVLSYRLSTLPKGWSAKGLDNMARLRAFDFNGGNMYDLAVYQRTYEEESQADGKEGSSDIGPYSVRDLFRSEKSKHKYGKYYDNVRSTVSPEIQSTAWYQGLIGASIFR